jgi:hypothetical protein
MQDLSLQEMITAHTALLAKHLEEFLPLIRLLRLLGKGPVSPEEVATMMHGKPQQVEELLHLWGLVVDAEGAMQTVAGSGCALDTLLFPMLTGRSSSVVATCPATGRQFRLRVTEHTIEDLDPPGAVLSLRLPGETTDAENVQATICTHGHFFVDREQASAWPGLHPETVLLPVEEAAHLARALAEAACGYAAEVQR